jgi:HEAT repeat protein
MDEDDKSLPSPASRQISRWTRLALRSFPMVLAIIFFVVIARLGVGGDNGIADPPPPLRTDEERELARLARICKGDGYTRAVRSYIKAHGAEAAIPFLIHAFGNSCSGCPQRAKAILLEIGAPAVPALIRAAQQKKQDVFGTLQETYSEFDPTVAVPPLAAALKDAKTPHREELLSVVGRLGPKAKNLVPTLVWILDDDATASLDLQSKVVQALCAIGPDAATAGPAVVRFLKDVKLPNDSRPKRRRSPKGTGRDFRFWASFGHDSLQAEVGRLGAKAEGLLDFLIAEIERPKNASAFDAIAEMGLGASRARQTLRAALNNGDRRITQRACYALWKTGEPLENVLPLLLEDLKKPDAEIMAGALRVLADIGPPARSTFPNVLAVTITAGDRIRYTALDALARIDPPAAEVVPSLIGLLKDLSPEALSDIIRCIEHFGRDANAAIPRIVELLRDKAWRDEGNVAHNPRPAAFAIRKMGTPPALAVPGLTSMLSDEDWVVQETAALLLGNLGKEASEAVPRLRQLIHQPTREDAFGNVIDLRDRFAKALFEIDPKSKVNQDLIATLLDAEEIHARLRVAGFFWKAEGQKDRCIHELGAALSHERVSARELAAELLSQIGPAAAASRPALREALSDDESTVRGAAKAALTQIGQ